METTLKLTYRGRVLMLLGFLAALAAMASGDSSVRLAAAMLLAPFLVDLCWGGFRLPSLDLRVSRRRTEAGSPFEEMVRIKCRSTVRGARDVHLREPRTETHVGGVFLPRLGAGGDITLPMPARTRTRGWFRQRVVVAISSHPLGLFRRTRVLRCDSEMISEPARMRLPAHVLDALERPQAETLNRDEQGNEEFHHLREYGAGEDARLVHALRSATSGTLVRRVLRCQQQPETSVILDLRRPPGRSARLGSRRLEWSLGATANLIDHVRARAAVVTVLVLGSEERLFKVTDDESAADFLAFLAEARSTLHWQVSEATLSRLGRADQCLWVPAGGFKASQDREGMGAPVLVTEWDLL